jgi:hypothetical protein
MAATEAVALLRNQLGRGSTGCGRRALFARPDFINTAAIASSRSSTSAIQLAQPTSFHTAPTAPAPRRLFSSSSTARARLVDDQPVQSPTFGARESHLPPGERDEGLWACLAGETARALWRQAKARVEAEERQRSSRAKRTNFVSVRRPCEVVPTGADAYSGRAAYLEAGRVPILPALACKAAVQPRLAVGQAPFRSRQARARLATQEGRESQRCTHGPRSRMSSVGTRLGLVPRRERASATRPESPRRVPTRLPHAPPVRSGSRCRALFALSNQVPAPPRTERHPARVPRTVVGTGDRTKEVQALSSGALRFARPRFPLRQTHSDAFLRRIAQQLVASKRSSCALRLVSLAQARTLARSQVVAQRLPGPPQVCRPAPTVPRRQERRWHDSSRCRDGRVPRCHHHECSRCHAQRQAAHSLGQIATAIAFRRADQERQNVPASILDYRSVQ